MEGAGARKSREGETRSGLGTTSSRWKKDETWWRRKKKGRKREREKGGVPERAYSGNEVAVDHGGVDGRGARWVRAAPYLRNFKLNCDVFKLRFLPEQPAPARASLLFSSARPPRTSSPLQREARR